MYTSPMLLPLSLTDRRDLSGMSSNEFTQPIADVNDKVNTTAVLSIDQLLIDESHMTVTDECNETLNRRARQETSIDVANPNPTADELLYQIAMNRITMIYQNVRGLRGKTKQFKLSSTGCDSDLIAVTESGLHPGIYDVSSLRSLRIAGKTLIVRNRFAPNTQNRESHNEGWIKTPTGRLGRNLISGFVIRRDAKIRQF
ncbi:uncharacterized protein LOC119070859 [Bradysia coprophila]|uniref:uncharacterized protein LOC119070859 n=1 Tax=Bradysia coprophila TaxID=38358 RepID=UPI00187DAE62|nr:uncharacterized protein LOC119070859 [Bradysia coprophila]